MSINPYDDELNGVEQPGQPVSRRDLFKQGAAAVVGGAAMLGGGAAFAQAPAAGAAQSSGRSMAGTRFRAYVRSADFAKTTVETLTLLPIQPRQVVIRMQAAQACYTIVNALSPVPPAAPAPGAPRRIPTSATPRLSATAASGLSRQSGRW
ncbi:MAG: hypothetical protein A3G76_00680 [Acidobacteria bacterium RIFCSPLOWO2_12_FULL_65_11]|nr:MAG: hypothetical protein A3H95_07570 [Acidobacteria bacterium RIFCSPLOWO2_02_FULL_64_15]OFW34609.1 MAG: hypothetical protein A3G76_00680 [Acidobacteria bacterium RIFCSPLOWO2_12_FULL_65_11]